MRILFVLTLVFQSIVSFPSWSNELDGKILNCQCKPESQNCIYDLHATGNEKKIAFRKHEFFRIFSIVFSNGKALRFFPVENEKSDEIFITGTSIDNAPKYSTTMDEILIPFLEKQEGFKHHTSINRETLIYNEEWQVKFNTGFEVLFSTVATCAPDNSMFVFELQNLLQEQYKNIKSKNIV